MHVYIYIQMFAYGKQSIVEYIYIYIHISMHTHTYIYRIYSTIASTKDMSFQNLVAKVEAERREQERLSEVKKKDSGAQCVKNSCWLMGFCWENS